MKCSCGNRFNKVSHAPRVLGCGHTFCHFCISTILDNGEIVCIFCDYKHAANGVTDIPLNFFMLDTLQEDDASSKENVCATHKASFKGFCAKCKVFICKRCFKDLHNADFGCVEASMEKGFETLSTGHKVDHLSRLIQIYSENWEIGETKIEEAKRVEMAFRECLWSATNDRQHLELYYENLEKKIDKLVVFKESLSECRSLNDFDEGNKMLSIIEKMVLTMEKDATPKLLPSCANLLNNLPLVIGAFQGPMTRKSNVFAVHAEKESYISIFLKGNGIWSTLYRPIADLPPEAFSFEMTDQFEKFALRNQREFSIIWGSNLTTGASNFGSLGLIMEGCHNSNKDTLKADIDLLESTPEDIQKSFKQVCAYGKANGYGCCNDINFVYLYKCSSNYNVSIKFYNSQVPKSTGISAKSKLNSDENKLNESYFLSIHNVPELLQNIKAYSQKLDTSRGCPVLALNDIDDNIIGFVFMKFPIVNVPKTSWVIGYSKGGIVGDFEDNPTDWSAEFRLL